MLLTTVIRSAGRAGDAGQIGAMLSKGRPRSQIASSPPNSRAGRTATRGQGIAARRGGNAAVMTGNAAGSAGQVLAEL